MQKKLNAKEMMKAMFYGEKIRLISWEPHEYVYFKNNEFLDEEGSKIFYFIIDEEDDWELYDDTPNLEYLHWFKLSEKAPASDSFVLFKLRDGILKPQFKDKNFFIGKVSSGATWVFSNCSCNFDIEEISYWAYLKKLN